LAEKERQKKTDKIGVWVGGAIGIGIGVEQKMKRQLERDGSLSFH
jgi:hypothetical protein